MLGRDVTSFARFVDDQLDFGESRSKYLDLFQVDDRGLMAHLEIFAENRLGDAIRRMFERHADLLPQGPEHARAASTARSVAAVLGPFDLGRYAAGIAEGVEFVDHRIMRFPSGRGGDELLRSIGTLLERADAADTRIDDILALRSDAFVVRWTTSGTDRVSRGPLEWQFLRLCVFGADGLLTRAEQFDVDDDRRALARFDELTADAPAARFANAASHSFEAFDRDQVDAALARYEELSADPVGLARIENAATHAVRRWVEAWNARDWRHFAAVHAAGFRHLDRRKMVQLESARDPYLDALRPYCEMASSRHTFEVLATRGDRLVLSRMRWEGTEDFTGPSVIEVAVVIEVDDRGDLTAMVTHEVDDLDTAYAELDDRYAAGSDIARLDEVRARFDPAAAGGTSHEASREGGSPPAAHDPLRIPPNVATRATQRFQAALEACDWDAVGALCAPIVGEHAELVMAHMFGTLATGGGFEAFYARLTRFESGRVVAVELFEPEDLDLARTRFKEICAP
jgi:SnoaL-like domain